MKQPSTHEWKLLAEHAVADCPNVISGIGLQDDRIAQMHPSVVEHYIVEFTAADVPVDFSPEPDPGVRASLTYYDETHHELAHHVFTHRECVAIASLIASGFYRRVAAAWVHQGYALAVPEPEPDPEKLNWGLIDEVTLGGKKWRVIIDVAALNAPCCHLRFVEDYGVVAVLDDKWANLDDPPTVSALRTHLPTLIGRGVSEQ